MSKKYIYSPMKQDFWLSRKVVEEEGVHRLKPKGGGGSGIKSMELMDTGNIYPTVEELVHENYLDYYKVQVDKSNYKSGSIYVQGMEDVKTQKFMFEHEINSSGTYYQIEYKHMARLSMEAIVSDYSPLYKRYEDAITQVDKHIKNIVKEMEEDTYELEKDERNREYRLILGRYNENGELPTTAETKHYTILKHNIADGLYERASTTPEMDSYVVRPWTHFERL